MAELLQLPQTQYILLWQQIGRTLMFHRWAGLSGALAIIFTVFVENCKLSNYDKHFITLAIQINYVHTLILMAVPLTRRPNLVSKVTADESFSLKIYLRIFIGFFPLFLFYFLKSGTLFLIGMGVYCLGCYFCALTNFNGYIYFTTVGSVILIMAWLSFLF